MTRLWQMSITVLDGKGQKSEISAYLESEDWITEEVHDPADYAQEYARIIDSMIDGQITAISVKQIVSLPDDIKTVPSSDSDVEEGVKITWQAYGGFVVKQRIPTINESFILSDGTLNEDDPGGIVDDFIAMVTNPLEFTSGEWTVRPVDNRGEPITDYVSGKENFTKSRKR